jgi:signal transduction histidine kinase
VKIERVSLARLIESLREEFPTVPGRDIRINYHVAHDCEVMANGLLREVFVNLIGNAIKHSPLDRCLVIDVVLGIVEEDGKKHCEVTIADNGPGIPDLLKTKLFQRFAHGKTKSMAAAWACTWLGQCWSTTAATFTWRTGCPAIIRKVQNSS